jgi:primosomal protein N' (replication factor Y)
VLLVSPCPTVVGLAATGGRLHAPSIDAERAGWPIVEVVDRSRDEPWRTSLVTSPLVVHLRRADRTVVCVHNTPGRSRILACRSCRSLARCERCEAAVGLSDEGTLVCRRCGAERPATCLVCNGTAFANLKPGVTRLREELEAAAGRPVVAVTGRDPEPPSPAGVYVGTEAVLHRVDRADVVAFLDLDVELLAPRYRAAEQAMALLVRAARLLGPRRDRRDGRLLLQTFVPRHDVIRAALLAEPGRLVEPERERRRALELPPFAALAALSGPGSDEVARALRTVPDVAVGGSAGRYVVRAASWERLGTALIAAPRPKGSRVRIEVDPPRL